MRYLVTGAAGFIGSHLVSQLRSEGHHVVGVDSFTPYYDRRIKMRNSAGLDVHEVDLLEADLAPLFRGLDGVFHLAGQPGVRGGWADDFSTYALLNTVATARVFDAAAGCGVRVVFASTSSVYGDAAAFPTAETTTPLPVSPYGVTKLACENLAYARAADGLEAIGLRFFSIFGPRQRPDMAFTRIMVSLISDEIFRVHGDGEASRSFTYVGDAVDASIAAMTYGTAGETYNVSGGVETSLNDVLAEIEALSGRTVKLEFGPTIRGDVRRTRADTRKAHDELGWTASTTLSVGLAHQWDWLSSEPRDICWQ